MRRKEKSKLFRFTVYLAILLAFFGFFNPPVLSVNDEKQDQYSSQIPCFFVKASEVNNSDTENQNLTKIKISDGAAPQGENTTIKIIAYNAYDLSYFDIEVAYDPSVLTVINAENNQKFGNKIINVGTRKAWIRLASFNLEEGLDSNSQNGLLLSTLTVRATGKAGDISNLGLTVNTFTNSTEANIPHITQDGRFRVSEPGDMDCDGMLTMKDAIHLAKYVVGLPNHDELCSKGDVNCDEMTDLSDAIYLAKHIIGKQGYTLYPCSNMDSFVQCLNESRFKIYGANWCPYCQELISMFGGYDIVNPIYVECTEYNEVCNQENISMYPTIKINGHVYHGERSIQAFSQETGCPAPE